MDKYHIGNLHIENCEPLNGTSLLLAKSSKIAPDHKTVEAAYFMASGKELTPLPEGMPEIIYAQGADYVFAYGAEPGAVRIRSSSGNEIVIKQDDPYLSVDGKIEISTRGRVFFYDAHLNKIGESDRFDYHSDGACLNDQKLVAQGYHPIASAISKGTVLYEKEKEDDVLGQYGKENYAFRLKAIKGMRAKRFCFIDDKFYVLFAKEGTLQLNVYGRSGAVIEETKIKAYDPELRILEHKLILLYDDHSEWTNEEKASYPEFSLGPTTIVNVASF
jgi:hypothetical protein